MSWGFRWRPYVPVAQRQANASRAVSKMMKAAGRAAAPVVIEGRQIAHTFWGNAWCDNLEAYSDFANRLPRGRTYVRNGSVMDLQIAPGLVTALVAGSELYTIQIHIKSLAKKTWTMIQSECAGGIHSLMELLQGRLSSGVMQLVTRPRTGLFPTPSEIQMKCSCPDWAGLCKHLAAVLYGVGPRLDQQPELLFLLRGVDPADLISQASAATLVGSTAWTGSAALAESELSDVFGIELESRAPAPKPQKKSTSTRTARRTRNQSDAPRKSTKAMRKDSSRATTNRKPTARKKRSSSP